MTTLTMQDEKRIENIQRVFRGELTAGSAAVLLEISERPCYRIKRRVSRERAKGVVHATGAAPVKTKAKPIKRIVELAERSTKDLMIII